MSVKIRCRDLLALEYPEYINQNSDGGCTACPICFKYLPDPEYCRLHLGQYILGVCYKCWDREIEIDDERAEKLGIINKKSEEKSMELKDSGNRRKFGTGAVRDIQEGKGRCDLMPLDVIGRFYCTCDYISHDRPTDIFECLDEFKVTGHTAHLYKAIWKFIEDVYPDPETAFLELSKHFEDGAKKYGDNNWQKGIPVSAYMDSGPRHYLKWLRGDDDEPHDRAFMWNIVCCIWTMEHKPELDNFTEKGNEKNGKQSKTERKTHAASEKADSECLEECSARQVS